MNSMAGREKGFVVVFLVALAWGAWSYRGLFTGSVPARSSDEPAASAPANPSGVADPATASSDPLGATRPDWGMDPFNRPWRTPGSRAASAATVVKKQALWLTAIVVRPNQRYAVINGRIVREGQEVAGRQVTRIEASRVLVDDNGVEVTLTL